MDRFRRRGSGPVWVQRLTDPFSLDHALSLVKVEDIPAVLSWLYAAIERGRVEPLEARPGMYCFVGRRRHDDEFPAAMQTPGAPVA